ncbi:MAG: SCO family protein [Pyrinomonadaceae bacterium]
MSKPTSADANQTVWEKWFLACSVTILVLCFGYTLATARVRNEPDQENTGTQGNAKKQEPVAGVAEQSPTQKYFTDVVLINQNGEKMRFYSDLLKGKVVIINSFFATCQGSCLPMSRNLEKVQQALGDHVGKDVFIISISVDPLVDTPAKLKDYAKKFNARPGWYFLTGDKENVEFALKKLGHFVDDKQNHLNIFIIGNERTGLWKKAFGLAQSAELIKIVESVLNDQATGGK